MVGGKLTQAGEIVSAHLSESMCAVQTQNTGECGAARQNRQLIPKLGRRALCLAVITILGAQSAHAAGPISIPAGSSLSDAMKEHSRRNGTALEWRMAEDYILDAPLVVEPGEIRAQLESMISSMRMRGGLAGARVERAGAKSLALVGASSINSNALSFDPLHARLMEASADRGMAVPLQPSIASAAREHHAPELNRQPASTPIMAIELSDSLEPNSQYGGAISSHEAHYDVMAGELLSQVLERWAAVAGKQVVWRSSKDYQLDASARFSVSTFEGAIESIAEIVGRENQEVRIVAYSNDVIVVSEKHR